MANWEMWYHQLAAALNAGLPLPAAISACRGASDRGRQQLAHALEEGTPPEEALENARWLPPKDRRYLQMAARTGRWPETCGQLAERHELMGKIRAQSGLAALYPVLILHVLALLLPVMRQIDYQEGFNFSVGEYLLGAAMNLGLIWAVIVSIYLLFNTTNPVGPVVLRLIPFFGGFVYHSAIAELASSLRIFVETGIPIDDAWRQAGRLAERPNLREAAAKIADHASAGGQPSALIAQEKALPPDFSGMYASGEQSGSLDRSLEAIAKRHRLDASHQLKIAGVVYPIVLFLIAAAFIVVNIFRGYGAYLNRLTDI